ncbi:hypothetical protein PIB30_073593 [Stylosanthes scabra]|uniref:Uncharacterized protein n=1 Tax=Stylosanthes scabra TaxID=79078 RepID=A0ABU6UNW6_9FABA|nr:hypothetical protein [Stylosanthes scabra]
MAAEEAPLTACLSPSSRSHSLRPSLSLIATTICPSLPSTATWQPFLAGAVFSLLFFPCEPEEWNCLCFNALLRAQRIMRWILPKAMIWVGAKDYGSKGPGPERCPAIPGPLNSANCHGNCETRSGDPEHPHFDWLFGCQGCPCGLSKP